MAKSPSKKTPSQEAPKMCMRHIDTTTRMLSDNPNFRPVSEGEETQLPKGAKRVDASTVITPAKK